MTPCNGWDTIRPNNNSTRRSMKKCCSWLPEAVAIGGVAIGVGVALRGWPSWPEASGQTWAAWVQAAGSILAIIAAFLIGKRDREHALWTQRRANIAQLQAILVVADRSKKTLRVTVERLRHHQQKSPADVKRYATRRARAVRLIATPLEAIDFSKIPYAFVVAEGLNMVHRMRLIAIALEEISGQGKMNSTEVERIISEIDDSYQSYVDHLSTMRGVVGQYDGESVSPKPKLR